MSVLIGVSYFIAGGYFAGPAIYELWQFASSGDEPEGEYGWFFLFLLCALIFWAAWPLVWGVRRARILATPEQPK